MLTRQTDSRARTIPPIGVTAAENEAHLRALVIRLRELHDLIAQYTGHERATVNDTADVVFDMASEIKGAADRIAKMREGM